MTNNEKIAALTADAIRALGENTAKDIMNKVDEADAAARDLRKEAEAFIEETLARSEALAERVNSFITACQSTTEDLKARRERVVISGTSTERLRREVPVLISDKDLIGKSSG